MSRGTSGLGLHGGGTPFDPAQHYRVDGGRIRTGLVAAQWALVDHPPGGGGFMCIPGSHKSGYPAAGDVRPRARRRGPDARRRRRRVHRGADPRHAAVAGRRAAPDAACSSTPPATRRTPTCSGPTSCSTACTERQRLLLQPPSVGGHRPSCRRPAPADPISRCASTCWTRTTRKRRRRPVRRRVSWAASHSSVSRIARWATAGAGRQALEAVRRAGVDVQVDGHAGVAQPHRVVDVLVGEPVDGADRDQRRRQPGEVGRPAPARRTARRRRCPCGRRGTRSSRTCWRSAATPDPATGSTS